ncbi:MAG: hypothetical protein WDZ88_02425 [Candidatus Paceibacterota bacterium]
MTDTPEKIKKYKLWYKVFLILGMIAFLDNIIFSSLSIPFVGVLILYPLLSLFLSFDMASSVLGFYLISWIFLFIPAFILNQKIKSTERESGIESSSRGLSKGFKITLMVLLIPFGIALFIGIIANLAG